MLSKIVFCALVAVALEVVAYLVWFIYLGLTGGHTLPWFANLGIAALVAIGLYAGFAKYDFWGRETFI